MDWILRQCRRHQRRPQRVSVWLTRDHSVQHSGAPYGRSPLDPSLPLSLSRTGPCPHAHSLRPRRLEWAGRHRCRHHDRSALVQLWQSLSRRLGATAFRACLLPGLRLRLAVIAQFYSGLRQPLFVSAGLYSLDLHECWSQGQASTEQWSHGHVLKQSRVSVLATVVVLRFRFGLVGSALYLHDPFAQRHKQRIGKSCVNLRIRISNSRAAERYPHGLPLMRLVERSRYFRKRKSSET